MKKLTVALLSGGASSERDVSLNSGRQVYEALDKSRYDVLRYDPVSDIPRLVADALKIDAALIILHGPFGEDGTVQGLLDLLNIPYQGAGVLGSALAMNKLAAKRLYETAGLRVPPYRHITRELSPDASSDIIREMGLPLVVKPVSGGSSIGMSIVRRPGDFSPAVQKAFSYDASVLVEAYIEGVEVTAGVLGNRELEALPLIEIIPGEGYDFFDYEAKYTPGATREICPARIGGDLTREIQSAAMTAHGALFCRGYSRTDFIVTEDRYYLLETNTIPGMTATSLLPLAAQTAGYSFSRLLDRLIALSLEDRPRRPL